MRAVPSIPRLVFAAAVLNGLALARLAGIETINPIDFTLTAAFSSRVYFLFAAGVAMVAAIYHANREKPEIGRIMKFFWLLLPTAVFPPHLLTILAAAAVYGWIAQRLCPVRAESDFLQKSSPWLVGIAVILASMIGARMQILSFEAMQMQWHDWGHYHSALLNTLNGRFFWQDGEQISLLGYRFCPALLIYLPYVALFPDASAFFFISSLTVCSGALALYWFCRAMKFTPTESGLFGMLYLLNPGIMNLNLSLIDSFHEFYLVLPCAFLILVCYHRKHYPLMVMMMIFTALIRETVLLSYIGFALALLLQKKYKPGAILATLSLAGFILIYLFVMPSLNGFKVLHGSSGFYSHLGGSPWEVLLSPLLRPGVFFPKLFNFQNLYLVLLLALPLLPLWRRSPLWMVAALPDLLLLLLDYRHDSQNITRHYQTAIQVFIMIAAVYGFARIRQTPQGKPALCGALIISGMMLFFFSQLPFSPSANPRVSAQNSIKDDFAEFLKALPEHVKVTADTRIAAQLSNRNPVDTNLSPENSPLHDHIIFDLFFPFYGAQELRDFLVDSPAYGLKACKLINGRYFMYFERGNPNKPPPPIATMSTEEFASSGTPGETNRADFTLRVRSLPDRAITNFLLRVEKRPETDMIMQLCAEFPDGQRMYFPPVPFGNGLHPAYRCNPGDVFYFSLPSVMPAARFQLFLMPLPPPSPHYQMILKKYQQPADFKNNSEPIRNP